VNKTDFNLLCQQIAISAEHLQFLLDEIGRHIPNATVWAFGSRVTGEHRPASDLDLAVHCDKETALKKLPKLNERLIESDLPFKVQLLDYNRLPENMQGNIKEKYVVLYPPQEEISGK
jgi:predicted nucleotidyltransferase